MARCVFTAATKREVGFFHSCFGGGVSSLVAKQHRHTHKHTLLLLHSNWVYYLKLPITVKYIFFKCIFIVYNFSNLDFGDTYRCAAVPLELVGAVLCSI